jgi:hypothetical protein
VAVVAGYLFALWPVQIEFTSVLASELIFNFLLVALLVIWESPRLNPWLKSVLIGLVAAAACYIRPIAFLVPIILYAITINRQRKFVLPTATAAVAYVVMVLAIAPWSVRNSRIFSHFVLISTNGGPNLWMGNNPTGEGGTETLPDNALTMQEAERATYLGNIAKGYIRAYPGRFVLRTMEKVVWTYSHETIGVHWNLYTLDHVYGPRVSWLLKLVSDAYWCAVLLLGFSGAVLLIVQRGLGVIFNAPPLVFWAYFTALHAVIVAQDRYHFPSLPFIGILAAFALCAVWRRVLARADRPISHQAASS